MNRATATESLASTLGNECVSAITAQNGEIVGGVCPASFRRGETQTPCKMGLSRGLSLKFRYPHNAARAAFSVAPLIGHPLCGRPEAGGYAPLC